MNDIIMFMAAPTVMLLILALAHCYLGLHVLARGVIFVDLSLAQVASLGAICGLLLIPDGSPQIHYFVSLGSTFLAASLFALARRYEHRISQEAIIGIVYAFASAAVVLVLDRLTHGAEHLKEALVGQILLVTWEDVIKTFAIYAVVGFIHFIFRKQLWMASTSSHASWFWDFIFYALFGVIIASSTHIAGVLLVFSLLIVPSVMSTLVFNTLKSRLIFGWLLSSVLSVVGMILSYKLDVPVGAMVVVLFTSAPVLTLLTLPMVERLRGPAR